MARSMENRYVAGIFTFFLPNNSLHWTSSAAGLFMLPQIAAYTGF